MNEESRPKAASEDLAGGLISSNYPTSSRISHARQRDADFYAARDEIAAERARSKARADGAPVRPAGVDEHLRLIDEGCALPDAGEVGND